MIPTWKTLMKLLAEPFHPYYVKWFPKAGQAMAYITSRSVMDRLDDAVGPENWYDRYEPVVIASKDAMLCTLYIRTEDGWVGKQGVGVESQIEGEKGSEADSLKRAAVKWRIGRYLYRLPKATIQKGQDLTKHPPALPAWALPEGYGKEDESDDEERPPYQEETSAIEEARQVLANATETLSQVYDRDPLELRELMAHEDEIIKAAATIIWRSNHWVGATGRRKDYLDLLGKALGDVRKIRVALTKIETDRGSKVPCMVLEDTSLTKEQFEKMFGGSQ